MPRTSSIRTVDSRPLQTLGTNVLVVGGGAAGVAAAVAAARRGAQVLLLERYGFCGGGAVAGMSGTICGLYEASEDPTAPPRQLVFGFAHEFVELLESRSGVTPPVRYGKTFSRVHDPLVWRDAADHVLAEAGVQVLLHTQVIDVLLDGGERVAGVVAWTKEGRIEVRADLTIDASGDADLFPLAGLSVRMGDDGSVQNPTMMFRLAGVNVERFLAARGADSILPESVGDSIRESHERRELYLPRAKVFLFTTPRPGELLCNATRAIGRDGRELNPLVAIDLSEAETEGRRQVRQYAEFFRRHLAGCENTYVNDTGVQVGVRQSRQIVGRSTLANNDVVTGVKRPDGIARSPWPIELHSGPKPRLHWLFNDYYEVAYGCFVPERGLSLLAAGRCLSAQHEAMASARVTAQCFSYGHAIGIAAAICVQNRLQPAELAGEDIRAALNRERARLDV